MSAPKRLTIAVNGRQALGQPADNHAVQLFSLFYSEQHKRWGVSAYSMIVRCPLECVIVPAASQSGGAQEAWGTHCVMVKLSTGDQVNPNSAEMAEAFGEWVPDLTAIVQYAHALQNGATLTKERETSAARRYKLDKHGVGSLTYHRLVLPETPITA